MGIDQDEVEIIGSWVMLNGRMVGDDASHRIDLLISAELQQISIAKNGWERLYRDPRDGRLWELTFPHGEMQGGGPQALLLISPEKALEKYGIPKS